MNNVIDEIREEDYRMISELQHFAFCRRQWALIHLEQQWNDNLLTVEGELMHKRVHDESQSKLVGDVLTIRGMRVVSHALKCAGICDAVEFTPSPNGIHLQGRDGKWSCKPVEYKHGKPKIGQEDSLQLCAQAICLEEMLCCHIPKGDIFYAQPHRRTEIELNDPLRKQVVSMLAEMNEYYVRAYTPTAKRSKACSSCSLKDICLPELEATESVQDYISRHKEE